MVSYMFYTKNLKLVYKKFAQRPGSEQKLETTKPDTDPNKELHTQTDADWATERDRKSISGGISKHWGNTVKAWSKKQKIRADSTSEAELISLHIGWKTATKLENFLKSTQQKSEKLTSTYDTDSGPLFKALLKQNLTSAAKHYQIRWLRVRDESLAGRIRVRKIPRAQNTADFFTKCLDNIKEFRQRRAEVGLL